MINKVETLLPWGMFKTLFKGSFGFEFVSLDDLVSHSSADYADVVWHNLTNWERLDDEDILRELVGLHEISGKLYVITEASYKKSLGPFLVEASDLEKFVSLHLTSYGECFFNGDVMIINMEKPSIWAFHHEGVFTYFQIKGVSRPQ